MTFTEIASAVTDYCILTSPAAVTRVGKAINRHYRRITSSLGLDASRFVTRSASMSIGVQTVTFSSIEKIDRVLDTTDATAIRLLQEVSIHQLRSTQPGTGPPGTWAPENVHADTVTVLFDTVPQTAYSLQADGWTSLADLSGTDKPAFPESYHDILVWAVIAEELLKKEKDKLAATYAAKAEALLRDLRFFLADSPTRVTQQASDRSPIGASGAGGGSGNVGGSAYTQTALITFDRGAGIVPFAVARTDAPYVVNLGAEFLGNLTTDRLIGRDTAGTGESEQLTVGNGLEFTGAGGIGIANDGVTYARMQNVSATSRILGRKTAAAGDAEECTLSDILDFIGSAAQGDVLYRGASSWARLAAGTSGQVLKTNGAAANPAWMNAPMVLLKANSGTDTNAGATNVDTIAISGLTALDLLVIDVHMAAVTQQTATPALYNNTDALTILLQLLAGGNLAAGSRLVTHTRLMQDQSGATAVVGVGFGGAGGATVANTGVTFTTNWTGSWTLALRHAGVTAGGTLRWRWSVYKVAGQ